MGVRRRLNMWKSVLKCDGPPVENGIFVHIFSILYTHLELYTIGCAPHMKVVYIFECAVLPMSNIMCVCSVGCLLYFLNIYISITFLKIFSKDIKPQNNI